LNLEDFKMTYLNWDIATSIAYQEGTSEDRALKAYESFKKVLQPVADKDPSRALWLAQLLENQQRVGRRGLFEPAREAAIDQTTTTLPVSAFPIQLVGPAIVAGYRKLFALELVTVSAINAPAAKVLYEHYVFDDGTTSLARTGSVARIGEATLPKRVRAKLDTVQMDAEKFSLGMAATVELIEDARAYNLDLERRLVDHMSNEIQGEIDWTILQHLYTGAAAGTVNWASTGYTSTSYVSVLEYNTTIWHAVLDARNAIYNATYLEPDFIVAHPDVCIRFEKLQQFAAVPEFLGETNNRAGAVRVGTLNGQFRLYKSAALPAGKAIIGVSGACYIYAPYIPLQLMPTVYYATQEWEWGMRTRAARKYVRPECVAVLNVT